MVCETLSLSPCLANFGLTIVEQTQMIILYLGIFEHIDLSVPRLEAGQSIIQSV